jgi:hypothetical protein
MTVIVSQPRVAICTRASTRGKSGASSASGSSQGNRKPKNAAAQVPVSKKGSGIESGTF